MRRLVLCCAALLALLSALLAPARPAQAAPRCFGDVPGVGDCIDGELLTFWERQGGLAVFGYPLGPAAAQGPISAQPFERARLELHPENRPPYRVLLGRVGADALAAQGRDWTALPKGDPQAPHYVVETGHTIAPQFWGYWSSHGLDLDGRPGVTTAESLALFGLPLSEAAPEVNPTDGQTYLTQWYERARFEYHPENRPPYDVLLGLLVRETGGAPAIPPQAAPAPADPAPGGFIAASGRQLTRLGQPVWIKGVNYYPQGRPWAEMWRDWDGPQVQRELALARDQLGINAVRVLLPYNFENSQNIGGDELDEQIGHLRQLVQIAGQLELRLIVTLFDFARDFPGAGSRTEAQHLDYLRAILSSFADDERIMAWDLHNEPDNYGQWKAGDEAGVLDWLGRMADEAHRIAPRQLVTVGMSQPEGLWRPGPDGRRVVDYSDVVSIHIYDAGAAVRQIDAIRAQTGKPILVEEFGWPTDMPCLAPNWNEATQTQLYRDIMGAARSGAAGALAWTLRDYDQAAGMRWDSHEEHMGLYRADGSLKPAAAVFQSFAAPPLPSASASAVALTANDHPRPNEALGPLAVPGSGHTVKGAFRRAWELLGGQAAFGLPITEAYIRQSDGRVVQYFEGAMLEMRPGRNAGPEGRSEEQRLMDGLRPGEVGAAALGARRAPGQYAVDPAFAAFYAQIHGEWRLGAPISGLLAEQVGGAAVRVQYFERGRLDLDPASQSVRAGPVGAQVWQTNCLSK